MDDKILSHYLDSDSEDSDSQDSDSYQNIIETALKKFPKVKASTNDYMLLFLAGEVLSSTEVQLAYKTIKSPLQFSKEHKLHQNEETDSLIMKEKEINQDLKDCFLLMPVASNTLNKKYEQFQKNKSGLLSYNKSQQEFWNTKPLIEKVIRDVQLVFYYIKQTTRQDTHKNIINNINPFIKYLTGKEFKVDADHACSWNPKFALEVGNIFIKGKIYCFQNQPQDNLQKAVTKYLHHKEKIQEVQRAIEQYHCCYQYQQAVQSADFLPQVLLYSRSIKNLIKDVILSPVQYEHTSRELPYVMKEVPVIVKIYSNTHAVNLFVHNIGSYEDIAKEDVFDSYMKYFLNHSTADVFKNEAVLYVLMQIEVIRNPSALLTNSMFLLLVQKKFKTLRNVEEGDSLYCWANIHKQLPMAMKGATKESIQIMNELFQKKIISKKMLFDYREVVAIKLDDESEKCEKLSNRNGDILFDWICYKIDAKQIIDQLSKVVNYDTTLTVQNIKYNITSRDTESITLTSTEYVLCFKVSNQISTHHMSTRQKNIDNSTFPNTKAYSLASINKFPLNVFDDVIAHYSINGKQITLDKLQGCVNILVTPRDIQQYPTPEKSNKNTSFSDMDCEENNSSQESSPNTIRRTGTLLDASGLEAVVLSRTQDELEESTTITCLGDM